jgi:hypothetical protein
LQRYLDDPLVEEVGWSRKRCGPQRSVTLLSTGQPRTGGLSVREWLSTMPYEFQQNYDVGILARFGKV